MGVRTVAGLEVLRDLDSVDDVVGVVLVRRACCAWTAAVSQLSNEQKQDKNKEDNEAKAKEDKEKEQEESDSCRRRSGPACRCGCSSQTR